MGQGIISSIIGTLLLLVVSYLYCYIGDRNLLKSRIIVWRIVSSVYLFSAFVVCFSFSDTEFFVVSDCVHYIANYQSVMTVSAKETMDTALKSYIELGDNNALFNIILNNMSFIANRLFDGVNSFYYALLSVMFGVLSSITLFRILSRYYSIKEATKYTLLFSLLSLYHFYSVVIIRDICITTFYLLSFEVVLKKFSISGLPLLVLYMLLAWGFRLYSGLFISLFILYYIYLAVSKSKLRIVLIPIFGAVLAYVIISSMLVINQSMEEIEGFMEYTQDRVETGGGMLAKLLSLPPGIKQIALVFFTQLTPLPPYSYFLEIKTLSNFYLASLVFVYAVFWYIVSYTFFCVLLVKKYYRQMKSQDVLLLLVVLVFIIANTAHPDIRRMMPVYPIIYFYYLKMKTTSNSKESFVLTQKKLVTVYCCLLLLYNIVKG